MMMMMNRPPLEGTQYSVRAPSASPSASQPPRLLFVSERTQTNKNTDTHINDVPDRATRTKAKHASKVHHRSKSTKEALNTKERKHTHQNTNNSSNTNSNSRTLEDSEGVDGKPFKFVLRSPPIDAAFISLIDAPSLCERQAAEIGGTDLGENQQVWRNDSHTKGSGWSSVVPVGDQLTGSTLYQLGWQEWNFSSTLFTSQESERVVKNACRNVQCATQYLAFHNRALRKRVRHMREEIQLLRQEREDAFAQLVESREATAAFNAHVRDSRPWGVELLAKAKFEQKNRKGEREEEENVAHEGIPPPPPLLSSTFPPGAQNLNTTDRKLLPTRRADPRQALPTTTTSSTAAKDELWDWVDVMDGRPLSSTQQHERGEYEHNSNNNSASRSSGQVVTSTTYGTSSHISCSLCGNWYPSTSALRSHLMKRHRKGEHYATVAAADAAVRARVAAVNSDSNGVTAYMMMDVAGGRKADVNTVIVRDEVNVEAQRLQSTEMVAMRIELELLRKSMMAVADMVRGGGGASAGSSNYYYQYATPGYTSTASALHGVNGRYADRIVATAAPASTSAHSYPYVLTARPPAPTLAAHSETNTRYSRSVGSNTPRASTDILAQNTQPVNGSFPSSSESIEKALTGMQRRMDELVAFIGSKMLQPAPTPTPAPTTLHEDSQPPPPQSFVQPFPKFSRVSASAGERGKGEASSVGYPTDIGRRRSTGPDTQSDVLHHLQRGGSDNAFFTEIAVPEEYARMPSRYADDSRPSVPPSRGVLGDSDLSTDVCGDSEAAVPSAFSHSIDTIPPVARESTKSPTRKLSWTQTGNRYSGSTPATSAVQSPAASTFSEAPRFPPFRASYAPLSPSAPSTSASGLNNCPPSLNSTTVVDFLSTNSTGPQHMRLESNQPPQQPESRKISDGSSHDWDVESGRYATLTVAPGAGHGHGRLAQRDSSSASSMVPTQSRLRLIDDFGPSQDHHAESSLRNAKGRSARTPSQQSVFEGSTRTGYTTDVPLDTPQRSESPVLRSTRGVRDSYVSDTSPLLPPLHYPASVSQSAQTAASHETFRVDGDRQRESGVQIQRPQASGTNEATSTRSTYGSFGPEPTAASGADHRSSTPVPPSGRGEGPVVVGVLPLRQELSGETELHSTETATYVLERSGSLDASRSPGVAMLRRARAPVDEEDSTTTLISGNVGDDPRRTSKLQWRNDTPPYSAQYLQGVPSIVSDGTPDRRIMSNSSLDGPPVLPSTARNDRRRTLAKLQRDASNSSVGVVVVPPMANFKQALPTALIKRDNTDATTHDSESDSRLRSKNSGEHLGRKRDASNTDRDSTPAGAGLPIVLPEQRSAKAKEMIKSQSRAPRTISSWSIGPSRSESRASSHHDVFSEDLIDGDGPAGTTTPPNNDAEVETGYSKAPSNLPSDQQERGLKRSTGSSQSTSDTRMRGMSIFNTPARTMPQTAVSSPLISPLPQAMIHSGALEVADSRLSAEYALATAPSMEESEDRHTLTSDTVAAPISVVAAAKAQQPMRDATQRSTETTAEDGNRPLPHGMVRGPARLRLAGASGSGNSVSESSQDPSVRLMLDGMERGNREYAYDDTFSASNTVRSSSRRSGTTAHAQHGSDSRNSTGTTSLAGGRGDANFSAAPAQTQGQGGGKGKGVVEGREGGAASATARRQSVVMEEILSNNQNHTRSRSSSSTSSISYLTQDSPMSVRPTRSTKERRSSFPEVEKGSQGGGPPNSKKESEKMHSTIQKKRNDTHSASSRVHERVLSVSSVESSSSSSYYYYSSTSSAKNSRKEKGKQAAAAEEKRVGGDGKVVVERNTTSLPSASTGKSAHEPRHEEGQEKKKKKEKKEKSSTKRRKSTERKEGDRKEEKQQQQQQQKEQQKQQEMKSSVSSSSSKHHADSDASGPTPRKYKAANIFTDMKSLFARKKK